MKRYGSRFLLPLLGLAALTLAVVLYKYDRAAYFKILILLIIEPYKSPFIDAQQVPAVIDCWRQGVNVYLTAPCDPLHRVWAYSPLWLSAGVVAPWQSWMGLALDSIFFLSLAMFPQPSHRVGIIVLGLATFSSTCVFALERGNMDLVMFLLIIIGGSLWVRNFELRLTGYSFFVAAGFLKFYPFFLCILFIRESIAVFMALSLAVLILLADFVWTFHTILHEASQNLPLFSIFTATFGSKQLPEGLSVALPYLLNSAGVHSGFVLQLAENGMLLFDVWLALITAAIALAIRFARWRDFQEAVGAMAPVERGFLLIGAILVCCCFFAWQNNSYRGIHLLFVLPGLLTLSGISRTGRIFGVTAGAIVFVMWGQTIQLLVAALSGGKSYPMGQSAAIYVYWIFRELTWWWIISTLLGVLFCFITSSPVWRALQRGTLRESKA